MKRVVNFIGFLIIIVIVVCINVNAKSVLTLGHDDPPSTEGFTHLWAVTFKNLVETRTNGEIEIRIYAAGSLGGQREMAELVQEGNLDIHLASPGAIQVFMPEMGALEHPFLFPSEIVAKDAASQKSFIEYARAIFNERMGVYLFGFLPQGFYQLTNSLKSISSLKDLKGIKVRTMDSPAQIKFWSSLGASPTPIAWGELYTSLQLGVIDAQTNPLPTMLIIKLEEVQKYCTMTNHMFSFDFVLLKQGLLENLSKENRIIVEQSMFDATEVYYGFARKQDAVEVVNYLKEDRGFQFTSLSFEEREIWKDISQKAMLEFYTEQYGDKAVELLEKLEIATDEVLKKYSWK